MGNLKLDELGSVHVVCARARTRTHAEFRKL